MQAEILTIGSELLSGATVNTNASRLAQALTGLGLSVSRQTSVADDRQLIVAAIREALRRSEFVIASGGLGPTADDVTMASIAEAVERPLTQRPAVLAAIRRFYSRRRRTMHRSAHRQALLPKGGFALSNRLGTAPGLWLSLPAGVLVALPGVPDELASILNQSVLPRLKRLVEKAAPASTTLRTIGVVELDIERHLRQLSLDPKIQIGLYPHLRMVDIRMTRSGAGARAAIRKAELGVSRMLGSAVYGKGAESLEAVVIALLGRRRLKLATAESCTGGLLAHRLTNVPGSSKSFLGGAVAYHNRLKEGWLGVPIETLSKHGAVSRSVAASMARGVRNQSNADLGIGITGIAGPAGGSRKKPVGLTYIALSDKRTTRVKIFHFLGTREMVKLQAAQAALDWLRLYLS